MTAARIRELVGAADIRLVAASTLRSSLGTDLQDVRFASVVPLVSRGQVLGAFLVGHDELSTPRRSRDALVSLASDAALALDNARLFDAASARAADAARKRIANDLHDSVAQSLAHIRMELQLLALESGDDETLRSETERLARVAGRALDDVRATIAGLRSKATDDGLTEALRRHIHDLGSSGGPTVQFESTGDGDVDPVLRSDLLRVAQEAISNATRHADAHRVTVSLEVDEELIELVVEDDGCGLPARLRPQAGRGVGLRAMQERAAAIAGELTIRDRVGGGTVVRLRCPNGRRPVRDRQARHTMGTIGKVQA